MRLWLKKLWPYCFSEILLNVRLGVEVLFFYTLLFDVVQIFKTYLVIFRMKIVSQHRKEMHDIQDIMFAMEEEWNELENDAKQDFQSLRDEIKNKVTVSGKVC